MVLSGRTAHEFCCKLHISAKHARLFDMSYKARKTETKPAIISVSCGLPASALTMGAHKIRFHVSLHSAVVTAATCYCHDHCQMECGMKSNSCKSCCFCQFA